MALEIKVQEFVHKLEVGGWVKWIRRAVLLAGIGYILNMWFYRETGFIGLTDPKAIEQAQVSREFARGNGFTTKMIRPAALWQFQERKGTLPVDKFPDTYHAPIPIVVNAAVFRVMDAINERISGWVKGGASFLEPLVYEKEMSRKTTLYIYDKMIAFTQTMFFLLAVLVNYFIAKRLFDKRLALLGMGLLLLCDQFWAFSMSGLPQMLMLFVFSSAVYCLLRAVELRAAATEPAASPGEGAVSLETANSEVPVDDQPRGLRLPTRLANNVWFWLASSAFAFGLLALCHGLTTFVFLGALLFVGLYFRPFGSAAAVMAGIFLLVYTPWMVRNYQVCGSPVGLGWYSALYQIRGSESSVMRSMQMPLEGVSPRVFRNKIQNQTISQFGAVMQLLGSVVVAPAFFLALMHLFRRRDTSAFRWGVLSMWLFGVLGMAVFGLAGFGQSGSALDPNNLHVLFIPMATFYGLAFVLVMWSRLEINIPFFRGAFITLLFLLSSIPFLTTFMSLHSQWRGRVQWPPYVPPYIAVLAEWTTPREMITSDMPWAVSWYADRTCLWLPMSLKDFIELNDYNVLQKPIVGMYLTPISGNQPFVSDVVKGDYKEWAPFIMRNARLEKFPLRAVIPLPIDNECVFYADRDRWSVRED